LKWAKIHTRRKEKRPLLTLISLKICSNRRGQLLSFGEYYPKYQIVYDEETISKQDLAFPYQGLMRTEMTLS